MISITTHKRRKIVRILELSGYMSEVVQQRFPFLHCDLLHSRAPQLVEGRQEILLGLFVSKQYITPDKDLQIISKQMHSASYEVTITDWFLFQWKG